MLAADSASKSLLATDSEASGSQLLGELGEGLLSLGDLGSLSVQWNSMWQFEER